MTDETASTDNLKTLQQLAQLHSPRGDPLLSTQVKVSRDFLEAVADELQQLRAERENIRSKASDATEYVLAQINAELRARIAALEADRDALAERVKGCEADRIVLATGIVGARMALVDKDLNEAEMQDLIDEQAQRIEQLTAQFAQFRYPPEHRISQLEAELADLTASRDRHERDVDTWRERWKEKCAEVDRLVISTGVHLTVRSEQTDRIATLEKELDDAKKAHS